MVVDPRRVRPTGFTLIEALLAASLLSMGVGVLWDLRVHARRLGDRVERATDRLEDLTYLSTHLTDDIGQARSTQAGGGLLTVRRADGSTSRYRSTARGLVHERGRRRRRLGTLESVDFAHETVGVALFLRVRVHLAGIRPRALLITRSLEEVNP